MQLLPAPAGARMGVAARSVLQLLEEARCKYRFVVHGYVVMPEHFHLLMNEPQVGDPSVVMKVVKERFSRQVHQRCAAAAQMWLWEAEPVWQKRFYDFNVWENGETGGTYLITQPYE